MSLSAVNINVSNNTLKKLKYSNMKGRLFFERYLCTNITGKQHTCFQFRAGELAKELGMFKQDHKKSSLGLCELHVADNYDDSRAWTKIIVLVIVWELYRILLALFKVPKSTHIGTQVQLPLLGSEMCLCHIPSLHEQDSSR